MAISKGRLVKKKKDEKNIYFVLSIADSITKGKQARIIKVHPSPRGVIGYVDVQELVPCEEDDYRIGDALSRLVVRSLSMKGGTKGISMRAGATIFKPFQLRPLMSYLGNPRRRILIADEVGLGKTISTIYIMVEEMARNPMDRIVIVCPSHLRSKWRTELLYRFGLYFDVVNGRRFLDILGGRDRYRCIISMDAMRRRMETLRDVLMVCPRIDMVIVDEAHHIIGRGNDTLRREFVQSISLISDRAIGLTATPLHIELMDLKRVLDVIDPKDWSDDMFLAEMELKASINRIYRLLNPSDPKDMEREEIELCMKTVIQQARSLNDKRQVEALEQFSKELDKKDLSVTEERLRLRRRIRDIGPLAGTVTRTRRSEVGEDRAREIINVRIGLDRKQFPVVQDGVEVSVSEQSLFSDTDELLRRSFSHVHRRQLSSCLPAMIGLMESGMSGFNVWTDGRSFQSDYELSDMDEEKRRDWKRYERSLSDEDIERCKVLVDRFNLRRKDTKFDRMIKEIRKLKKEGRIRKVIVFTQWRPTIEHMRTKATRLEDMKCFIISGEDHPEKREATISRFQGHEGFSILFTADVLAEGLDLYSADCIVNYDLPYNPQRVEQRIGRVDRIGQTSEQIAIINMLVKGSIDEEIYDKLLSRIGVFERYIGEAPPTFTSILSTESLLDQKELAQEIERIEDLRKIQEHDGIQGLDDVLDDDIVTIYRTKRQKLSELRLVVLRDLFQMALGKEAVEASAHDYNHISLKELGPMDAENIAQMVPMECADDVRKRIRFHFGSHDLMSFSIEPYKGDWYVPLMHPLMESAVQIVRSHHFPIPDKMPVDIIEIGERLEDLLPSGSGLIISEHMLNSPWSREVRWNWWKIDRTSEHAVIIEDIDIKALATSSRSWRFRSVPKEETMSLLTENVKQIIDKEHVKWSNELMVHTRSQMLTLKESEAERIRIRLWRLEKTLRIKSVDELVIQKLMKARSSLERDLREIETEIEDIKGRKGMSDHKDWWRLIALIDYGGDLWKKPMI